MTRFFTHPVYRTLLALFCCALWGSAFPALKIGYVEFHLAPGDRGGLLIFAGSRFLTASLIIMGAGFLSRGRSFTGSGYGARRTLMILLVIGVLQTTLQYLQDVGGNTSDMLDDRRPAIEETLLNLQETTRNLKEFSRILADQPDALIRGRGAHGRKGEESK